MATRAPRPRLRGREVVRGASPGAGADPAELLTLHHPLVLEALYVSPRTVQTHLAHVFTKLGISSRTQLAAEATRRRGEA